MLSSDASGAAGGAVVQAAKAVINQMDRIEVLRSHAVKKMPAPAECLPTIRRERSSPRERRPAS
jgi:hypothetical protein